jgi:multiple sugar transport system ATP-binding protein
VSRQPFLVVRGVSKRFGKVEALRSVTLDAAPDELLVVLGPTGAGKTTLLRTIAGLEEPHEGAVLFDGVDVTRRPPAERDAALVFQNFSLYPNWTVRRNLAFPLRAPMRKLARAEIDARVRAAAATLKIAHLLDRRVERLSGGEMQRVAIGRAIVRRPRIFLMDEPLTNLDAKLREALRVELVRLRRELDRPMVFVTHDQVEAMSMGDRVAVLSEGRILQVGTPEEIYRSPASPQVAQQLGQPAINLLPVSSAGGQWRSADGTPLMPAGDGPEGREMLLGVRPEDIAPAGGTSAAAVQVVEDMGPVRIVLARWAGAEIHLTCPPAADVRVGQEIFPRIDPARAILWPAQPPPAGR